ncbi:unnamed protein product [Paramecium sonneborni]|uniref:Uncharacterized protein n=1 Tax=Paramecium sonneborni TaxID=65129 RepID=A0A8S1MXB9_9CILI|nr:unnamed protein product [Paramecium sonneborni]
MDNSATTVINKDSKQNLKIIKWISHNQNTSNLLKFKKELAKKILREQKKAQLY